MSSTKQARPSLIAAALLGMGGLTTLTITSHAQADAPKAPAPARKHYSPEGDAMFAKPYIDIDEWRDAPVRHRYVHGGFTGTETRFSFYLPPKEQYQGRFFQHITPVPDNEKLAQADPQGAFNKIGFAIASGAYFVETNGGGKFDLGSMDFMKRDPTIAAYRANAAAAAYSRTVAMQMYGGKRPFGYAYGGSGGAFRTIGSIENTTGVWDGAVPYVMGTNMAIPNMFTVRMQAMRILRDKFDQIVDAASPGGSGDMYAGLDLVETEALREVTKMGFPAQSWYAHKTMGIHGFAALYGGVVMADQSYFTDFWTKPGYLGHDHPERFVKDRVQFSGTVAAAITAADAARMRLDIGAVSEGARGGVDDAFKVQVGAEGQRIVAFRLAKAPPPVFFLGGDLMIESGAAKGKRVMLKDIKGDIVVLGVSDPGVIGQIKIGDSVRVDNSNFLAIESYHRHQVPDASYYVWDQFRKADGTPLYPQRRLIGPMFVQATAGSLETGEFEGKMIVCESLWDREALPWSADWYRGQVRKHLGAASDDHFRVYYTDHALHGDQVEQQEAPERIVSYIGTLQQALRDVAAWVEKGVEPPKSTQYKIADGQVVVPPTAAERRGVQPVVTLKANGGVATTIKAGETVRFAGMVEAPPQAGTVVAADWDFDGTGTYPRKATIALKAEKATVTTTYAFSKPGTYFVALRGTAQRDGDPATPYAQLRNIARVRVVVR